MTVTHIDAGEDDIVTISSFGKLLDGQAFHLLNRPDAVLLKVQGMSAAVSLSKGKLVHVSAGAAVQPVKATVEWSY